MIKIENMDFSKIIKRMDNTYKLNIEDIAEKLKNIGINVLQSENEYKPFNEVVEEIANKWNCFCDEEDKHIKSYIATSLVGIRDRNNLIALINTINEGE